MDLFNKKRVAALDAEIARYADALAKAREESDEAIRQKEKTQMVLDDTESKLQVYLDIEAKRKGKEPWVEITSDGFDEVKGVKIAMDWNDAFIDYLEGLSIRGPTAEAAVQRWLAMVNLHLIEQLESMAVDKDDRGTVNDIVNGY